MLGVYNFLETSGAVRDRVGDHHPDPDRPGDPGPALSQAAGLPAPDAAPPARAQGDPETLQGRPGQVAVAQQELFKERGINPLAGCLPLLLQLPLLFIMYSVISARPDQPGPERDARPSSASRSSTSSASTRQPSRCASPAWTRPFRSSATCPAAGASCTIAGFGLSFLAIASALLQLVQSRMMLPAADPTNDDPNARIQRQTMLFLPLISVVYGGFLPAGLFIYWIVATLFSIVAAVPHRRLGRDVPLVRVDARLRRRPHPAIPGGDATATRPEQACGHPDRRGQEDDGRKTIRPRERGRQGRRGRRR